MSDSFQVNPQSADAGTPSSTPGSVAPPRAPEQGQRPSPESQQPQNGQPAAPQQSQVAQDGQQPSQPDGVDYRSQYEQERQARLRHESELGQYRQAVSQIQRAAEEQQTNQALQQQVQMMLATADNMSTSEGSQYLKNQVTNLLNQTRMTEQQRLQQERQMHEQQLRAVAAPQYADHLMSSMGIPEEARQELLNLGDPDLMFRQAPMIKQRYDQWNQQRQQWEQSQQQLGRSQEVNALRQNGLTNIGGQGAGASYEIEVSDDPDERAMQILNHLRSRTG